MRTWKPINQIRAYLVWDAERITLLVIIEAVQGVSGLVNEGEISCPLAPIFRRYTIKSIIRLC